jgi:hypothetical protein
MIVETKKPDDKHPIVSQTLTITAETDQEKQFLKKWANRGKGIIPVGTARVVYRFFPDGTNGCNCEGISKLELYHCFVANAIKSEARSFAKKILSRPTYSAGRTDIGEFKQALNYILEITEGYGIDRLTENINLKDLAEIGE